MKKILTLILSALLCIGLLASCGGDPVTPEDPPEPGWEAYTAIVRAEEVNLSAVRDALYGLTGKMINMVDSASSAQGPELIFGACDRPAAAVAEERLLALLEETGESNGYIAYVSGGSVAVVWTDAELAEEAVAKFVAECLASGKELGTGVLFSAAFDLAERLETEKWAALEAEAPAELVKAFKAMEKFYDAKHLVHWYANLYDPAHGAFYFSASSRDYDGFLPDIESSAQVLNALVNAGMFYKYGDSYGGDALPDELQDALVKFVTERQDKDDGYFYHPQWGKSITTVKRGRDMTKALSILSNLGAKPKYPTALDNLGNYDDVDTVSALTAPMGVSAAAAVSRVIAAADIDSRFESLESFDKWLKDTTAKIKENSHNIGHTLSSSTSQIKAAGFLDYELDYLDQIQKEIYDEQVAAGLEPTGLFDLNCNYGSASGLYKICGIYNNGKRKLAYADLAAQSCIDIINIAADNADHPVKNIVYVFNPWGALDRVLTNIESYHGDEELRARVSENLLASGASVVYNTMVKLDTLRKADASFSYYPEHTSSTMQGAYISLGLNEGDVTATGLALAIYRNMFETMGFEPVRLYDDADRLLFIELLETMSPIEKLPTTTGEPIDFNDGDMPVNVSPTIQSGGTAEVIENPDKSGDYILHYSSPSAASMDKVNVKVHGIGGNLYVADFDICVLSADAKTNMQLMMGSCYFIELRSEGGKVALYDNSTTQSSKHASALNITAELGEWFNLRIEYYILADEVKIKVYKNGVCYAISDNYMGKETEGSEPSVSYDFMSFRALKAANVEIYLDNVQAIATTGEFDGSDIFTDKTVVDYDFEGKVSLPQPTNTESDRASTVTDPTNPDNTMLSYEGLRTGSASGQSIKLTASSSTLASATKTVSFDLLIPSRDLDGDGVMNEYNGDFFTEFNYGAIMSFGVYTGGKRFSDLRLIAEKKNDGDPVEAVALSLNNGKDDIGAYSLRLDTKYTVTVIYDFTADAPSATVLVNGESYLASTSLYADNYVAEGGIAYEIASMKRTKGAVYFDNLKYTEPDGE